MAGRRKRSTPGLYSPALGQRVADLVAEGHTLSAIALMPGMPSRQSIRTWALTIPEFTSIYEVGRRFRADSLADEIIALADGIIGCTDNAQVTATRVAIEAKRWLASRLLPAAYGDRVTQELVGAGGKDLMPAPEPDVAKAALGILALLKAARPHRTIDEILPPPPALPPPDPEAEARRLQAARTGAPLRLGTVDAPLPEFNPSPAPRRAPVEDLIDLDIRRRARKVQERIAPYVLKTWPP